MATDTDPAKEQTRVSNLQNDNTAVKVHQLSKSYTGDVLAVSNLSFALSFGECFALLGTTGAGKTTTFKCITGEEIPSSG